MKKTTAVLSVILTVIFIFSTSAPAAALDADKFEAKEVTAYIYSMEEKRTVTCLFDRDLPEVPYIDIADYFNLTRTEKYQAEPNGDGLYYLPGDYGYMMIDAKYDAVLIDEYEGFMYENLYVGEEEKAGGNSFLCAVDYDRTGQNPLYLDFGAYNIDIIEKDGRVYFPYSVLNDIFILTSVSAEYIDGNLYFDSRIDHYSKSYFDRSSVYNKTERSKALAEFTYNELCFQFDNFYGRPANAEISEILSQIGFDKTLDTYSDETRLAKQLLLSPSLVDFYLGMFILTKPFSDGGHSVLYSGIEYDMLPFYRDTELYEIWTRNFGKSTEEKWVKAYEAEKFLQVSIVDVFNNIKKTKDECLKKYEPSLIWDDFAALYVCGDTAVFCFDEFRENVMEPYRQSLDYAKEHGVKNFVIDLTTNGGGSTSVIAYITNIVFLSLMPRAAAYCSDYYVNTGNTVTLYYWTDMNLDGEFNNSDFDVVYDFNYAFLTSVRSFSSANECAIRAKENGIMIIGEKSGGGSCTVSRFITPGADYFALSSLIKGVSLDGVDNDCGAEADVDLRKPYSKEFDAEYYGTDDPAELGYYDYDAFYDFEAFGALIEEFYDRGDVNGDGVKNNKDVTELFNYVSETNRFIAGYDINIDGSVNNRDVYALFKKVSAA